MARTSSVHHPSKWTTTRNHIVNDQTRQRRIQHRLPPKRSVSALSASQLERKRANDREAQRLIRQRTKDRIDSLEQEIADLRNENEQLHRCLRQRSFCERETLQERNSLEAGNTSWNCSKAMNLSRSCGARFPDNLEPAPDAPEGAFSHVAPELYTPDSAPRQSDADATAPLVVNSSVYQWGNASSSTTCSPLPFGEGGGGAVDEAQLSYHHQRAIPTPVYQSLLPSSYQAQAISPVTLHCLLPTGQLHLLPTGRQPGDVVTKRPCSQPCWPL